MLFHCGGNRPVALFRAVRGAKAQGDRDPATEPTLPSVQSHTKEDNHGEEEKEEEIEVNGVTRAPRIGAAPSTSDFARSQISPSDRTPRSVAFIFVEAPAGRTSVSAASVFWRGHPLKRSAQSCRRRRHRRRLARSAHGSLPPAAASATTPSAPARRRHGPRPRCPRRGRHTMRRCAR